MTLRETLNKVALSKTFTLRKGIRQEDPLFTTLFNFILEALLQETAIRTDGIRRSLRKLDMSSNQFDKTKYFELRARVTKSEK